MNQRIVRVFALVAALGVAACGDDDPVASGDQLSEVEVQALSALILSSGFEGTASVPVAAAAAVEGPQPVPFTSTADVETTVPCTFSGSVRLSGQATVSGDDETQIYDVLYNVGQAHQSCVEQAETGQQFELTSSLNLNVDANIVGAAGSESYDFEGSVLGTVDWASEGRSGRCSVSIQYSASMTSATLSATSSGEVCGTQFSQEFTYGVEG
jgi:hypothetical protein